MDTEGGPFSLASTAGAVDGQQEIEAASQILESDRCKVNKSGGVVAMHAYRSLIGWHIVSEEITLKMQTIVRNDFKLFPWKRFHYGCAGSYLFL